MKKFLVSLAVAALAAPMFAQGAPQRVAVIDVQKILATSNAGKAAYERLKKLQDDRMARAQKMDDDIKALDNEINSKKLSLSRRVAVSNNRLERAVAVSCCKRSRSRTRSPVARASFASRHKAYSLSFESFAAIAW